jgi:hypothetical protein
MKATQKRLSRAMAVALALVLTLSLAACGGQNSSATVQTTTAKQQTTPPVTTTEATEETTSETEEAPYVIPTDAELDSEIVIDDMAMVIPYPSSVLEVDISDAHQAVLLSYDTNGLIEISKERNWDVGYKERTYEYLKDQYIAVGEQQINSHIANA